MHLWTLVIPDFAKSSLKSTKLKFSRKFWQVYQQFNNLQTFPKFQNLHKRVHQSYLKAETIRKWVCSLYLWILSIFALEFFPLSGLSLGQLLSEIRRVPFLKFFFAEFECQGKKFNFLWKTQICSWNRFLRVWLLIFQTLSSADLIEGGAKFGPMNRQSLTFKFLTRWQWQQQQ